LGHENKKLLTLKGFANRGTLSGFNFILVIVPRVVAGAPTAGLKLANAFGVLQTKPASN
jgi:hypothetical protein